MELTKHAQLQVLARIIEPTSREGSLCRRMRRSRMLIAGIEPA
jgi:hypothetical protein